MNILTLDVETTISNKGHFADRDNRLVLAGLKWLGSGVQFYKPEDFTELQEEIESFKKGSLAVKLNEVTKERNEVLYEIEEKKNDIIRYINTIDDLKKELKESEENRDQLITFNKNYGTK